MTHKRIIIYYQTLVDLSPLKKLINKIHTQSKPLLTDITLASIHFGYNNDKRQSPYMHLNNNSPSDTIFDNVYNNLMDIKKATKHTYPIKINLLIGGAGSAFNVLFSNYCDFYTMLKETVVKLGFIDGFNLDVEENVDINNMIRLVNDLKTDFPDKDIIFAPLASALATDDPGMGGFSYKELDNKIGDKIAYYNVQCYGEYSETLFNRMVSNGYASNKIVMGMLSGQDINIIMNEVEKIVTLEPNFGGVAIWEYFNATPLSPTHPYVWCEIMSTIMYTL